MGNFGRFDRFVSEYDPYGTNAKVQDRLRQRAYNQGQYDRQHAVSVTDQNEARRQALYDQDIKNKLETDDWQTQNHYTDYEKQLDGRGLLNTDIAYQTPVDYGDAPGAHPKTFQTAHLKVRGKPDAAGIALMHELAAQGQLSGNVNYNPETMAALNALSVERHAEAEKAQARTDQMTLADKDIQAKKELRAGDLAAAAAASDREYNHALGLQKAKQEADLANPNSIMDRNWKQAEIDNYKMAQQRAQDEYLTGPQKMALARAQTLMASARVGNPEDYHALQMLARDPANAKLGINPEIDKPSINRVLAQPQIRGELDQLAAAVEAAGYSPDAESIAKVKNHAARAVQAAADFGPDVQAEVARIVKEHIQHPSTAGSLAGMVFADPLGAIRAGYRYAHRNDANAAFADLTGGGL